MQLKVCRSVLGELCFLALIACTGSQRTSTGYGSVAVQDTARARQFVRGFYDWYAPRAGSGAAWAEVLKQDTLLHPVLLELLKDDYAMQGEERPPRSTIDGDPFTGQEDCAPFIVTTVRQVGRRFRVNVTDACDRFTPAKSLPSRSLEIAHNGQRWEILNVYYWNDPKSLIDWLCQYAMADKRPEKRPPRCGPP